MIINLHEVSSISSLPEVLLFHCDGGPLLLWCPYTGEKKEEEEYNRLLEYGCLKALTAGINSEDDVEKGIDKFTARGLLEKYKNVELRELENTAWPKAVESKQEHN